MRYQQTGGYMSIFGQAVEKHQPSSRTRRSVIRALQDDLQWDTYVCISDQTVQKRLM